MALAGFQVSVQDTTLTTGVAVDGALLDSLQARGLVDVRDTPQFCTILAIPRTPCSDGVVACLGWDAWSHAAWPVLQAEPAVEVTVADVLSNQDCPAW